MYILKKGDLLMQYGYARVSTLGQSLDNQVQDLRDNDV